MSGKCFENVKFNHGLKIGSTWTQIHKFISFHGGLVAEMKYRFKAVEVCELSMPLCHNPEFSSRVRQHSFQIQNHYFPCFGRCFPSSNLISSSRNKNSAPNSSNKTHLNKDLKKEIKKSTFTFTTTKTSNSCWQSSICQKKTAGHFSPQNPRPSVRWISRETVPPGLPEGNFQDHRCACRWWNIPSGKSDVISSCCWMVLRHLVWMAWRLQVLFWPAS